MHPQHQLDPTLKIYSAIYEAAKNQDKKALQEALREGELFLEEKLNEAIWSQAREAANNYEIDDITQQSEAAQAFCRNIQYHQAGIINIVKVTQITQTDHQLNNTFFLPITPVMQLAIEGNEAAVTFLLKHGARKQDAASGYVMGNHDEQAKALSKDHLKTKISREIEAGMMFGHAINKSDHAQSCSSQATIMGHAIAGHIEAIDALLLSSTTEERDEKLTVAFKAYATGGHTTVINKIISLSEESDEKIDATLLAIKTYSKTGLFSEIKKLILRQDPADEQSWMSFDMYGHAALGDYNKIYQRISFLKERLHAPQEAIGFKSIEEELIHTILFAAQGFADRGDRVHSNCMNLIILIDDLYMHGFHLNQKKYRREKEKGKKAMDLAKALHSQLQQLTECIITPEEAGKQFSTLMAEYKKTMSQDRTVMRMLSDIISILAVIIPIPTLLHAHLLAGAHKMRENKRQTGSFFRSPTQREFLLHNIEKITHRLVVGNSRQH
jgi:hypothetical protein